MNRVYEETLRVIGSWEQFVMLYENKLTEEAIRLDWVLRNYYS